MADPKQLKDQRDKFLAFSFASADLFLEIDAEGDVIFALGAAKSLTGVDDKSLMGKQWLDIFSEGDRATLTRLHQNARYAQRCGPVQVKLDEELGAGRSAILTAIKMPGHDSFYITIGFLTELMARMASLAMQQEAFTLLDKNEFLNTAKEALDFARSMGKDAEMTLLDIPGSREIKDKLGDAWWNDFTMSLTGMLSSNAIDGQAAAQIAEGRYSVVHDGSVSADMLREQLQQLTKQRDPEGKGFDIQSKTVTADLQNLSEREAAKALVYTINEFERKGAGLNIDNLNTSFKAYVSANAHKIQQFKSMVETLNFEMFFQPIVDMKSLEAVHYEMLARFRSGESTQEWIIFGEDIGMAADLDLAVVERVLNYITYKSPGRRTKFAINLSGQSIQNEHFFKTLMAKLSAHKGVSDRLIFEITESNAIDDLDMVSKFVEILQAEKFKVCLDDFGAGSASFPYIQKLPVDYVKIDGQYTRKVLTSERDRVMLKNLARMCDDLGINVVAEQIEQQQQADMMMELGIQLGQGYLYSKPMPKPEYVPPAPAKH